jgi:hypothetical protein
MAVIAPLPLVRALMAAMPRGTMRKHHRALRARQSVWTVAYVNGVEQMHAAQFGGFDE